MFSVCLQRFVCLFQNKTELTCIIGTQC